MSIVWWFVHAFGALNRDVCDNDVRMKHIRNWFATILNTTVSREKKYTEIRAWQYAFLAQIYRRLLYFCSSTECYAKIIKL